METYELLIKKVYEIASKHNKRLVIKPHPQKSANEEEIAKHQAAISCSLDNPDGWEMCSG